MLRVERALLVVALLGVFCYSNGVKLDQEDGGYYDLLVSIHQAVPANEKVVENLKVLLQATSEFLHMSTAGQAFIKKVLLRFPNTWPLRTTARSAKTCCFSKSDVRVDIPKEGDEVNPFSTKLRRSCGKHGDYIRISTNGLETLNSTRESLAEAAYTFVHEWAHFRYGVFYEYGRLGHQEYPASYCPCCNKTPRRLWNTCSQDIKVSSTNAECEYADDCYATEKCIPEAEEQQDYAIQSSIMFLPRLQNITKFCTEEGPDRHNKQAPNMHNKMCKQRSTWDVIQQNEDFMDVPRPHRVTSFLVDIEEIQQNAGTQSQVVLVLDVSQSMRDFRRLETLKDALHGFLLCMLDESVQLAMVKFSTFAEVQHPMVILNNRTRTGFQDAVDKMTPDSYTCIGCGLRKALEILSAQTPGGTIVLLTDGNENREPFISEVKPELLDAKVEVVTMAMGDEAEAKLEQLAEETNAKAYFFPDILEDLPPNYNDYSYGGHSHLQELPEWMELIGPNETTKGNASETMVDGEGTTRPNHREFTPQVAAVKADEMSHREETKLENVSDSFPSASTECFIDAGFDSSIRMQMAFADSLNLDDALKPIYVMFKTKNFTGNLQEMFFLDGDLGNNTIVAVSYVSADSFSFDTLLVDPAGQRCQNCREVNSGRLKTVAIPSPAMPGTWRLQLETTASERVMINILVMSHARDLNNEPIVASCQMSEPVISQPQEAVIFVDVSKGDHVVLDASVTAVVINTQHLRCPVRLRDDGNDPDLMENDGTYSGYFTRFTGAGRYSVTAYVYGDPTTSHAYRRPGFPPDVTAVRRDPTRVSYTQGLLRRAPENYRFKDTLLGQKEPTLQFQRITASTAFKVNRTLDEDDVPPGSIWDLKAMDGYVGIDRTPMVRLTWTWPGARMTEGKVAAVEIRGGTNDSNLISDFESHEVMRNVVKGNLDPLPAGAKHDVTIAIPRYWATTDDGDSDFKLKAYLAARVINAEGIKSDLSGTVSAEFNLLDSTAKSDTTTPAPTTAPSPDAKPEPGRNAPTAATAEPGSEPAAEDTREGDDPSKTGQQSLVMWTLLALAAVLVIMTIIICLLMRMKPKSTAEEECTLMKTATTTSLYTEGFPWAK